jgi:HEAT repeat protein
VTSLVALWEFSLLLCGIGALALLALVVARVFSARRVRREEAMRAELLPVLLGGPDAGAIEPLTGHELGVASDLVIRLAEMTRGSEREALLDRARAMGVPDRLARRLNSRSAQIRLSAVEALSLFEDRTRQARAALDDANPDVRLGAALALAGQEKAPPPAILVDKLLREAKEHSLMLISLMHDLAARDSDAVAALLYDRDVPVEAKRAAIDALAETGGKAADLLIYMARESDGEPDLQARIFRALGRTGHPGARAAIEHGLQSADWPVRAAAAQAAGQTRIADAAPRLRALLGDTNWWVRYRAGQALLALGPAGAQELRAARAGNDILARAAAHAMMAEGGLA